MVKAEAWNDKNLLIKSSDNYQKLKGSTYQGRNCYGGDILLALAEIVGIKIQSV